jgi:hypothetical protein
MTSFCTNCGSRFNDFSNFCTDCGSPGQDLANKMIISPPETLLHSNDSGDFNSAAMRFFANESAPMLPHYRNGEVCLVFTNLTLLRQYLGLEYDDLLTRISRLVNTSRSGLIYLLLDSSNTYLVARDRGTWASHVAILRAATDSLQRRLGARVASVFIIGDENVIPMPQLPNIIGPDADVDTDYPYASMSVENPWEAMEPASVLVGRLPVGQASRSRTAVSYLDNLIGATGGYAPRAPYGIGAEKWQGASRAAFELFSDRDLHISPPLSAVNLDSTLRGDPDLLYFNLHGSNEPNEAGWFGESLDGRHYPVVIRPEHFSRLHRLNIVGVEACYGAKFSGLSQERSSLLQALASGTLGFVGSSRIAFGPSEPPINLADVIIGHFLKNVSEGESTGQAHMNARNDLWHAIEEDAHSRLTVLEFNLFGDPNFVGYHKHKSVVSSQSAVPVISAADRLIQSIRTQAGRSRGRISKLMRRLRPEELITADIQRGLERCRQAVQSVSVPLPPGVPRPEPSVSITEVGGKKNAFINYEVKMGAVAVGCSIVQDFSTTEIKSIYIYH